MCNGEIMGKDHTLEFVYMTRWRIKVRKGKNKEENTKRLRKLNFFGRYHELVYSDSLSRFKQQISERFKQV